MLQKQAKILTKAQTEATIAYISTTRNPIRNKVIFLLSHKAGLRAVEISKVTWSMVTDAEGNISDCIKLENLASKGKCGGGVIWLNKELKRELEIYKNSLSHVDPNGTVILSNKNSPMTAQVIVNMFWLWYAKLGFQGCSSHSGRRAFVTFGARKISTVGGSLHDIQKLARHSSLATTQKYIESNVDAQRRIVQLI